MPPSARLTELSLWTITLQSTRTVASLVRHRQAVTSTSTSPIVPAYSRVVVALCSKCNSNLESCDARGWRGVSFRMRLRVCFWLATSG